MENQSIEFLIECTCLDENVVPNLQYSLEISDRINSSREE